MAGQSAALIGIDWGTTSLRAWQIAHDGGVLGARRRDLGILKVAGGDFPAAFAESVGDWRAEGLPVLMSGMIGSRQGWVEAPYVDCPADVSALAANLMAVPGLERVWIVPGLALRDGARRDVMRGEETQIAGAAGDAAATVILPGTHSKWVKAEAGRIADFATFMTGELFEVLARHSILGRLMAGQARGDQGFRRGVGTARDTAEGLSGALFSVRTLGLFGDVPPEALSDYLSGLLIGHEIREALRRFPASESMVIGSAELVRRYTLALDLFGVAAQPAEEDAAMAGLFKIAGRAGLIAELAS